MRGSDELIKEGQRAGIVATMLAIAMAMACGSETPRPSEPPATAVAESRSSDEGKTETVASATGRACQTDEPLGPGDCGEGYLCVPFLPQGYCTQTCGYGRGCGEGAKCVATPKAGELCMASCAAGDDCRDRYECDEARGVCTVAGMLPPVLASCPGGEPPNGAPQPRKTFAEPEMISTGEHRGTYSTEPTAELLPNGDLVVVYMAGEPNFEPNALAVAVVRRGGEVEAPDAFETSRKQHFDPWLARNGDRLGLVWLGHDGGGIDLNARIGFSTSTDGVEWTEPVPIHADSDCPQGTPFCIDKPMVARGKDDEFRVFYSSRTAGGMRMVRTGSRPSSSEVVTNGSYGDVRVDDEGTTHVVAMNMNGSGAEGRRPFSKLGDSRTVAEYVRSTGGGDGFSEPVHVTPKSEEHPFYFSNPQILHDTQRELLYVAYPIGGRDGVWDIELAVSDDEGESWERVKVNDDATCANHMKPRAELDPETGRVHLIWAENRGGTGRMAYTSCAVDDGGGGEDGLALECAANEILSAPFAAYGFVRHSSWWLGEYDVLVLDRERKVLHAAWAQPVDEEGVPTSRIFHATADLDSAGEAQ